MLQVSHEKDHYLTDFERFAQNGGRHGPAWVHSIRQTAMDRFTELRFPTLRDEAWRFTNISPILRTPFRLAYDEAPHRTAACDIAAYTLTLGALFESRLVFIDGLHAKELSAFSNLPSGVRMASLAEAVHTDEDIIRPHLARHAGFTDQVFTTLNSAFLRDGAFVYVPSGVTVAEPIHLLYVSTTRAEAAVSYPRNLIVLGRSSRATVIESYACLNDGIYMTNAVTEVVVGDGSVLEHYKIQREHETAVHLATTQVRQEYDSGYHSFTLDLGSALSRNTLNVLLSAAGAECTLNGLYLGSGRQHMDNYTNIDHASPHGTSRELYKGILDGKARAVFNGKILVRKDAQQTDASQTNKNLLLSDDAQVNTTPQLEILADDVKCSHGATVGQLDEGSLFYLKSRGIGEENARRLLTYAFAGDVINRIKPEPVRAHLGALVLARLH